MGRDGLSEEEKVFERKLRDYESRMIEGLGDGGEPAYLPEGEEKEAGERALKAVALNTVLSDRMPLKRKLKDFRNKG